MDGLVYSLSIVVKVTLMFTIISKYSVNYFAIEH